MKCPNKLRTLLITTSLFLSCIVTISCGDEEGNISDDARRPIVINHTDNSYERIADFAKTNIGPVNTISCIVIDSTAVSGKEGEKADFWFEEISNVFKKERSSLFADRGVLIYAIHNDSLVQVRVGSELQTYMTMKGFIAGSKYLNFQKEGYEKGIDYVATSITRTIWSEIDYLQNMGFWGKLRYKISVSWLGDVLYTIGKPSDSLLGKVPTFIAYVISSILGKTNSMFLTICIISLFIWLVNLLCDKLINNVSESDKNTMLLGHIDLNSFSFWIKLILNIIIITPTLGAFTFFSNLRTEDILYLNAHNMPFIEIVNWDDWFNASSPSLYATVSLAVLFFINYLLSPHRLLAFLFSSGNDICLLNYNHTLRDQCVDITRRGKWEFRLFLGGLAIIFLWEILHYLILFILAAIGWLSQFWGDDDSETPSIEQENYHAYGPSAGGGAGITAKIINRAQHSSSTQQLTHSTGKISYENHNYESSRINIDDEGNLGKSLAGMGISHAIASKLPRDFFKKPFECTYGRILKEAIILSCVLLIATPIILNEALTILFTIGYGLKIILSLAYEYFYHLYLENNGWIYYRYNHANRFTFSGTMSQIFTTDFWETAFFYFTSIIGIATITFLIVIALSSIWDFLTPNHKTAETIETFMHLDSTYDYKDGERVITFSHYQEACSFKRSQLGYVKSKESGVGYVDSLGNEAIRCQYAYGTEFFNERALVKKHINETLIGIDRNGKTVFTTSFLYAAGYSGGKSFVTNNANKEVGGFIDTEGVLVIPAKYGVWKEKDGSVIYPYFRDGKAKVKYKGDNCSIDSDGSIHYSDE